MLKQNRAVATEGAIMAKQKKRHHQSLHDRVHEGVGEEMYLRGARRHEDSDGMARYPKRGNLGGLGEEYYAGYDPRRTLEKRDGDMIHEDHNAVANLPQAAFQKEWPKAFYERGSIRPDNIDGIDMQMDNDVRDIRSNRMHNKA